MEDLMDSELEEVDLQINSKYEWPRLPTPHLYPLSNTEANVTTDMESSILRLNAWRGTTTGLKISSPLYFNGDSLFTDIHSAGTYNDQNYSGGRGRGRGVNKLWSINVHDPKLYPNLTKNHSCHLWSTSSILNSVHMLSLTLMSSTPRHYPQSTNE